MSALSGLIAYQSMAERMVQDKDVMYVNKIKTKPPHLQILFEPFVC